MAKVDSKGRIVLPQEIRKRLRITPGTEVTIREEDGNVIVEPEDDPEAIIEQMERLVAETSSDHDDSAPLEDEPDPVAKTHRETIRQGAERTDDE
jgi:AbrB family looped-hinge helix DNA binding protein